MGSIQENGHWTVIYNSKRNNFGIMSDDFTHDVVLWVDGDFYDTSQREEYANEIAKRLNAYKMEDQDATS